MEIELVEIGAEKQGVVAALFQLYIYDMTEYTGWAIGADGLFDFDARILPPYWQEADHAPYFIMLGDEVAGFAMIRPSLGDPSVTEMGQFFVLRKFKGQGIGAAAFAACLAKFPGKWQVRVLPDNAGAYTFWKRVIGAEAVETLEPYGDIEMVYFRFDAP